MHNWRRYTYRAHTPRLRNKLTTVPYDAFYACVRDPRITSGERALEVPAIWHAYLTRQPDT